MSVPANPRLYEQVKQEIYARIPIHSAYRSAQLVQEYKRRGGTYLGKKPTDGLAQWFKEEWRTQSGSPVYESPSDVFRPTRRIAETTPLTFGELSKKEIARARREKLATGRVKEFRPS